MARARTTVIAFDALSIEGALIAPDMLVRIAALQAADQSETDYDVPDGLKLRDEIGRYFRIGEALWQRFDKVRDRDRVGIAARDFVTQLLSKVFGFSSLKITTAFEVDGKHFPVSAFALGDRVPIVIAPSALAANEERRPGIDVSLPEFGDGGRRRSATLLLQEVLNAADGTLYGLVSDGRVLRLMRDNPSMTRPAWIEADLERIFGNANVDDHFADFSALWLLIHQNRFGRPGAAPTDCAFERWREKGREEGVKARERLRDGVEEALKLLGTGLLQHRDNESLRSALQSGALDRQGLFQELLRTIYRLIFLFTAEDRGLLHAPGAAAAAVRLYSEGYSLARLRTKAVRSLARDRNHDLFEGVRIVFRALERGEQRLALPALGGLFLRDRTPYIDCCRIENRFLLSAVEKLGWLREGGARLRVNWRDMETEELGSVYESLLELTPRVDLDTREFTFASGDETKGHARKTSGSYYTPDSLVQLLLDSALDPVIVETVATNPGREAEALLDLDIIDPACGSGHFLLAAARRLASRIAQLRSPGSPSAEDYRHALREVARHCLYGVDRNPLAVELCQVALWIETVEPGKPLSFLDGRIRQGDSLIGVFDLSVLAQGIPDEAYKALTGDEKDVVSHYRKLNKAQREGRSKDQMHLPFAGPPADLVAASKAVEDMPEDNLSQVAAKTRALAEYQKRTGWFQLKTACDLFVAAFFAPKPKMPQHGRELVPTTDHVWLAAQGSMPHGQLVAEADHIAHQVSAFHWPLTFADVMAKGGFDVVLGNPPWEVSQLDEIEYFSTRSPEIAALSGSARKTAIARLKEKDERLWDVFIHDKRRYDASNEFVRESGRFDLTARGKINTYALFAELFSCLAGPKSRAGVIVPTGIATDATTAPFFAALIEQRKLARLISFENEEFIFPSVHHSFRFCLLTISGARQAMPSLAFFLRSPNAISDPERSFILTPAAFASINPNTKTAPVFRSQADAELTSKIYARVPILFEQAKGAAGNPWGIEFRQGLFNMTSDSGLFRTAAQLNAAGYARDGTDWVAEGSRTRQAAISRVGGRAPHYDFQDDEPCEPSRYVPLYEAKMISLYDHRASGYSERGADRGFRVLPETSFEEHQEASFEPEPFYWVPSRHVEERLDARSKLGWLLGWKDVTAAISERTVIFSVIPHVGIGNTLHLMFSERRPDQVSALYANLNSLMCDYIARTKVAGLHLTHGYLNQLPLLPPEFYTDVDLAVIVPRVLELSYTSHAIVLGAKPDLFDPFPRKPPRMHRRTYEQLHQAYGIAKDRCFRGIMGSIGNVRKADR
jgi:hypothetical protein